MAPNGDKAFLSTLREANFDNDNLLTVEVFPQDGVPSIRLLITETKCQISRIGNEPRFKTIDILNEEVANVIQLLILVHPRQTFDPAALNPEPLVPSHPALKGVELPTDLIPIASVILGAPYQAARAATKRWMARLEKKERHLLEMKDIAKTIVDGTILGRIDTSTDELKRNKSRLALVHTIDPKGAKRKRQLRALCGFENARPCTAKQIARFEQLSSPDALALVHDYQLRRHDRDKLEAAFRLSFKLEPGARNPILEADMEWVYSAAASEQRPKTKIIRYVGQFFTDIKEQDVPENPKLDTGGQITLLPSGIEGWHLRLTDARPTQDIALWSAALAPINLAESTPSRMRTGAGFMALKVGDSVNFHLRPALCEDLPSFPETHFDELKRAIDVALAGSPDRKERYLRELGELWARMKSRLH